MGGPQGGIDSVPRGSGLGVTMAFRQALDSAVGFLSASPAPPILWLLFAWASSSPGQGQRRGSLGLCPHKGSPTLAWTVLGCDGRTPPGSRWRGCFAPSLTCKKPECVAPGHVVAKFSF